MLKVLEGRQVVTEGVTGFDGLIDQGTSEERGSISDRIEGIGD